MNETRLVLPPGQTEPAELVRTGTTGRVAPGSGSNRVTASRGHQPLPFLLAGPILRRCSPREIMVWVATSAWTRVTGRVADPELDSRGTPRVSLTDLGHGSAEAVEVGKHLFLTWITISAASRFPTGRILTYDLTFRAPDGHSFTQPGLLSRADITYGSLGLPSFILDAENVTRTHLMHASCRKLHGPGQDASPEIDRHLQQKHNDAQQRPRFLLLTGDQIYADDVPTDLSRALMRASRLLLGFRETLPGTTTKLDSLNDRSELVRSNGLTVDASVARHHLLGFGEFAAMYLLSWSPALWTAPGMETLPDDDARRRNLEDTVTLRRALANVPTYMMLDDHEITDDWPLDTEMTSGIDESEIGRWIVANGLASCWLFQLQGNGLGDLPQLAALRSYLSFGAVAAREEARREDNDATLQMMETFRTSYVGVPSEAAGASLGSLVRGAYGLQGLGALVPTVPPVLLVDTRTQRHLSERGAPGLLDAVGREWVVNQIRTLATRPSGPLLVVSPAPVIGNPTYDNSLQLLAAHNARYFGDREAWGHNPASLRDFLRALASAGRKIVLFSGDVHHGYTATGTFGDGSSPVKLIQLTSSAARNRPEGAPGRLLSERTPGADTEPLDGTPLRFQFQTMTGLGSTVFVNNNVGFVTLEWSERGVTVTHELRGEGQPGTVTVTI